MDKLDQDALDILENWSKNGVRDQLDRLVKVLENWDEFHGMTREQKDEIWDNAR